MRGRREINRRIPINQQPGYKNFKNYVLVADEMREKPIKFMSKQRQNLLITVIECEKFIIKNIFVDFWRNAFEVPFCPIRIVLIHFVLCTLVRGRQPLCTIYYCNDQSIFLLIFLQKCTVLYLNYYLIFKKHYNQILLIVI